MTRFILFTLFSVHLCLHDYTIRAEAQQGCKHRIAVHIVLKNVVDSYTSLLEKVMK
jgi:hypothetical protein